MSVGLIQKRCCCKPIACGDCFQGTWPPPMHYSTINRIQYPRTGRIYADIRVQHDWFGVSPWGPADERVGNWTYKISVGGGSEMVFTPQAFMSWATYSLYIPFTAAMGKFLHIQAFFEGELIYDNDVVPYPSAGIFSYPFSLSLQCTEKGWILTSPLSMYNLHIEDYLCVDGCMPEGNPGMSNYKAIVCKIYDYAAEELVPYNTANFFNVIWLGEY